jgi:hypothetical protein
MSGLWDFKSDWSMDGCAATPWLNEEIRNTEVAFPAFILS